MRIAPFVALVCIGVSSLLSGCVAGDTELDSMDDAEAGEERVGEAEEALVGCYGETCNGQDPGLMGCEADATTVASSSIFTSGFFPVGTIAIRRSAACNALWARASTSSGVAFIRVEFSRDNPPISGQAASLSATNALRSPMVGFAAGARFTARGFTGPSYGFYPNQGNVSRQY